MRHMDAARERITEEYWIDHVGQHAICGGILLQLIATFGVYEICQRCGRTTELAHPNPFDGLVITEELERVGSK
jgi:hypothetical protein